LLTFQISLQGQRYRSDTVTVQTFTAMADQLRTIPGVTEVSGATSLPVGGGGYYLGRSFLPEGRAEPPEGQEVSANWNVVLPGFFRTVGIPMLRGRDFGPGDRADGVPVMIVSRLFARRMFETEDVIGRRVRSWRDENLYREIVGVVDDVRFFSAGDSLRALVYVPHAQNSWGLMSLVMRTAGGDAGVVSAVRQAVQSVDPALAPSTLRWMDDVLRDSRAPQRAGAFLMLVFAALALVLAVVGIYGVLSYLVAHRSREIGVRMALGATRSGVIGMVLREALLLVVLGTAVGLTAAVVLTRSVSSLLFEVPALDLVVFIGVPVLLAGVALAASWVPARRASRVDPLIAMRTEA
jgi:predicted permease